VQRNRAGHTVGRIQPEEIREGGDEQLRARVYSALLRSRSIVLSANFKYCGPLDIVRLNHMLKVGYCNEFKFQLLSESCCAPKSLIIDYLRLS
jgi:hypothetical protein